MCAKFIYLFSARFYDNVILAILTYRHFTPMEKFEQFRRFIDLVDPARERIHLILPLIARSIIVSIDSILFFQLFRSDFSLQDALSVFQFGLQKHCRPQSICR